MCLRALKCVFVVCAAVWSAGLPQAAGSTSASASASAGGGERHDVRVQRWEEWVTEVSSQPVAAGGVDFVGLRNVQLFRSSLGGWGLKATRPIRRGTDIVTFPTQFVLSEDWGRQQEQLRPVVDLARAVLPNVTASLWPPVRPPQIGLMVGAVVLLHEWHFNPASVFKPYLQFLPDSLPMHPLYWTAEQWALAAQSTYFRDVKQLVRRFVFCTHTSASAECSGAHTVSLLSTAGVHAAIHGPHRSARAAAVPTPVRHGHRAAAPAHLPMFRRDAKLHVWAPV